MHDYADKYVEIITLKDGAQVRLRPIRPSDARLLQEGFKRLSAESIYMRFLKAASELSDEEARQLAMVDYHDRMALVGSIMEQGEEHLVVVARYHMLPEGEPGRAEAAIVVRDDYQNQGLGKIAMDRLIRYARDHGVTALVATVSLSNAKVMNFIRKSGLRFTKRVPDPGIWEITIPIQIDPAPTGSA